VIRSTTSALGLDIPGRCLLLDSLLVHGDPQLLHLFGAHLGGGDDVLQKDVNQTTVSISITLYNPIALHLVEPNKLYSY